MKTKAWDCGALDNYVQMFQMVGHIVGYCGPHRYFVDPTQFYFN